jgi:hypothetical protein
VRTTKFPASRAGSAAQGAHAPAGVFLFGPDRRAEPVSLLAERLPRSPLVRLSVFRKRRKQPKILLANPRRSRAKKIEDQFYVLSVHGKKIPLHPRRRGPGRGHLPDYPQPFPSPAQPGAQRHRCRRPRTRSAALRSPLLCFLLSLQSLSPPTRRRQRPPARPPGRGVTPDQQTSKYHKTRTAPGSKQEH